MAGEESGSRGGDVAGEACPDPREDAARAMLAEGRVDEALDALAAEGVRPDSIWREASALLEAGETEIVEDFIDGVKRTFEDYYQECGDLSDGMDHMVAVLASTYRDILLIYAFDSIMKKGEDPTTIYLLAHTFGKRGLEARLATIIDPLELDDFHTANISKLYRIGEEAAAKEAEQSDP